MVKLKIVTKISKKRGADFDAAFVVIDATTDEMQHLMEWIRDTAGLSKQPVRKDDISEAFSTGWSGPCPAVGQLSSGFLRRIPGPGEAVPVRWQRAEGRTAC